MKLIKKNWCNVFKKKENEVKSDTDKESEKEKESTPKFWGSVRMTYTICAFLAMVFHTWLRNTMNFVILCMVKQNVSDPRNTSRYFDETNMDPLCPINYESEENQQFRMTGDLEWTREEEFHMLSSLFYGFFVTMPIGGYLCDKFGGKTLFVNSLTLQAVLFIATPPVLRLNYTAGFLLRIFQGMISGLGNPPIYQLFSVWSHPSEVTATMGFAYGGFAIGSILAYPVSGQLCLLGWENAFYIVGLLILVICSSFYWLIYDSLDEHPRLSKEEYMYLKSCSGTKSRPTIPWKKILTSVPVYAFTITHVCHSYSIIVFTIIAPKMFQERMGFNLTEVSFYSIFIFLGSAVSKILTLQSGPIERKYQNNLTVFRRIVYVICISITIGCFLCLIYTDCTMRYWAVAITFIVGFATDVAFSVAYWQSVIFIAPSFSGIISSLANFFANLGGAFVPLLTSKIVKQGSKAEWDTMIIIIICSYALATSTYGLFGSSELLPWGRVGNESNKDKETKVNETECSSVSYL